MRYAHDPQDRFSGVMGQAFSVLCARGVADLPEFPLLGFDRGKDRIAVCLDRLMRHCDHITRRCDEIVQLLETMLTIHENLDGLEAQFDRQAALINSEDPETAYRAIRDYGRALNSKVLLRGNLSGVMSEAITVKFASISYTLAPAKARGRDRPELSRRIGALEQEKARRGAAFAGQNQQRELDFRKQQRKAEREAWQSLRLRRGDDLTALFEPFAADLQAFLDRDARDQIAYFDERIDTSEAQSPQLSFADLPPAELAALRARMAQLAADSRAVGAGIWRFRNRLPDA